MEIKGVSKDIAEFIMFSWRDSTRAQYIRRISMHGYNFVSAGKLITSSPSINNVLEFLQDRYNSGLGYSALNTAWSALSTFISIDNTPVEQLTLVRRFMSAVFNRRPVPPKLNVT